MIIFENTKEVCMVFVTQQHCGTRKKKTHTLTLCGNKSYRESQRRIQCLLLFEQHAGPLSVLDIISSFNYLQKRKTHISNSEEERNMHANRAAW